MFPTQMMPPRDKNDAEDSKKRKRRERTIFSANAVRRLEEVFTEEHYPDIELRELLARQIGVSEARIQVGDE